MRSLPYYYSGNAPVIQGGIPPKIPRLARSRQVQDAKRTVRCFSQSFYRYNVSDQTSSMIAISAASPRRGPSFVMRV